MRSLQRDSSIKKDIVVAEVEKKIGVVMIECVGDKSTISRYVFKEDFIDILNKL